jgi:hypothetical protein
MINFEKFNKFQLHGIIYYLTSKIKTEFENGNIL